MIAIRRHRIWQDRALVSRVTHVHVTAARRIATQCDGYLADRNFTATARVSCIAYPRTSHDQLRGGVGEEAKM